MKKRLILVTLLSAVSALIFVQTGWSQPPPGISAGRAAGAPANRAGVSIPMRGVLEYRLPAATEEEIGRLIGELGEADDAKKAELTKQLEAAVAKQFDRDMENRETDLTKLEERLNKLRAQLDRRRKAKTDIIQLQVKVLVNEAEGLGFGGQPFQPSALPKAATRSSLSPTANPAVSPAERSAR